jgi:hypothetical protein
MHEKKLANAEKLIMQKVADVQQALKVFFEKH